MSYENATDRELESKLYHLKTGGHAAIIIPSYCSDWNATMPLAVEHGVSTIHDDESGLYGVVIGPRKQLWVSKDKALRAIVICLIKALEASQ